MPARILSTGMFVPPHSFTNEELAKKTKHPIEDKIEKTLGIKNRYLTLDTMSTADLAEEAAKDALKRGGVRALDLDLLIVATDTPEYISPATSAIVQGRIGAKNAGIFDLNASCAGFVTAFDLASRLVTKEGPYKTIMVLGAYNMSKYVDWDNPKVFPIFADGAGAVILSATHENRGLLASRILADGTQYDYLGIYHGGTKHPLTENTFRNKEHLLTFLKPLPGDRNVELWVPLLNELAAIARVSLEELSHLLFTQINQSVIKEVMARLQLPLSKTSFIMDRYGYTGSACIPMALHLLIEKQGIKPLDLFAITASGVGFTVASVLFRY